MAIQTLTQEQIKNLQKGCPVLSKINFGEIINDIIESVNAEEPCTVVIDEATIKSLNDMCPLNGVKLGDLIQTIIDATQEESDFEEIKNLSISQIKALNQTCQTLNGCEIGDKAYEIIDVLNSREEPEIKDDTEAGKEEQ